MTIKFGTDGWRGIIAKDFTFENVQLVAQATADYVNEKLRTGNDPISMVVGYDTRFLSDRFAWAVSEVLAANDIKVWLTRADAPTPSVSYNVVAKKSIAGIMLTASHNPPRYNGFKVKTSAGGSASPEACEEIETYLSKLLNSGKKPNIIDIDEAFESGKVERFDPAWMYYEHLNNLLDMDVISRSEARVIADAMFGSGRGSFAAILARTRCNVLEIRGYMNPGFEGIHPEPIGDYLKMLQATIQNNHADIGLATDGDADRIGAMDQYGNFVDPHTIMALSLRYMVEQRNLKGSVVKTVSTTAMLNRIASKYNLPLHETPVGFNHIADLMQKEDVLIGGEESGGISIRGHIPEGDGILMGLMLLELMGASRVPLHEMVEDLQKTFGPTVYKRNDMKLKVPVPKSEMVKKLSENAPNSMAGQTVKNVVTTDGVKFILADESWLLIRPSGTEPVLRVYAEGTSAEAVDAMLAKGRELAGIEEGF